MSDTHLVTVEDVSAEKSSRELRLSFFYLNFYTPLTDRETDAQIYVHLLIKMVVDKPMTASQDFQRLQTRGGAM